MLPPSSDAVVVVRSRVLSALLVLACVGAAIADVVMFGPISTEDGDTIADVWILLQVLAAFAYGFAVACCSLAGRSWFDLRELDVPAQVRAKSSLRARTCFLIYAVTLAVGLFVPLLLSSTVDPLYCLVAFVGLPIVHRMSGMLGWGGGLLTVHPLAAVVAMLRWHPSDRAGRTLRAKILLQSLAIWVVTPWAIATVLAYTSPFQSAHHPDLLTQLGIDRRGVVIQDEPLLWLARVCLLVFVACLVAVVVLRTRDGRVRDDTAA